MTELNDTLSRVRWAGRESRHDPSYFWDNFHRYHLNQLVIQWTVFGCGFFRDEQGSKPVPAGSATLFTYDEPTSYGYPPEATEAYEFIALNLTPSRTLQPLFDEVRSRFGAVVQMAPQSEAAVALQRLFELYERRSFRDAFHESELILSLFHAIFREQQEGASAHDAIEYGFHAIRDHFRSPMNLKTLAGRCGISREHFIREFSARYLQTPGAMLRTLRLEHGRRMLLATRIPVQEIALDCAFLSSNSFARAYRRQFGCTPQEDRGRAT